VERRGGNGAGRRWCELPRDHRRFELDRSITVNTPGQSGQPGSPYYGSFLPIWENDEYVPMSFSRELVDSNAEHRLTLQP
jgi:acyl-homoserine lactone acylase PvdQ